MRGPGSIRRKAQRAWVHTEGGTEGLGPHLGRHRGPGSTRKEAQRGYVHTEGGTERLCPHGGRHGEAMSIWREAQRGYVHTERGTERLCPHGERHREAMSTRREAQRGYVHMEGGMEIGEAMSGKLRGAELKLAKLILARSGRSLAHIRAPAGCCQKGCSGPFLKHFEMKYIWSTRTRFQPTLDMQEALNLHIFTSASLMEKQAKNGLLELLLALAVSCLANLMIK